MNVDALAETLVVPKVVNGCAAVVAGASRSTPGPLGTQDETHGEPEVGAGASSA